MKGKGGASAHRHSTRTSFCKRPPAPRPKLGFRGLFCLWFVYGGPTCSSASRAAAAAAASSAPARSTASMDTASACPSAPDAAAAPAARASAAPTAARAAPRSASASCNVGFGVFRVQGSGIAS